MIFYLTFICSLTQILQVIEVMSKIIMIAGIHVHAHLLQLIIYRLSENVNFLTC